jgi:hypothetical protein
MENNSLRPSACLLAIVLFGALTIQAGFAEEPGLGARDDNKPSAAAPSWQPRSGGETAAGAAKFDDPRSDDGKVSAGERPPVTTSATAADGINTGDIDTSISVQPRRLHIRPGQAALAKAKVKPLAAVNFRRRMSPVSSDQVARNAIGAPGAGHAGAEHRDSGHPDSPISAHGSIGIPGTVGSVTEHVVKTGERVERPTANAIVGPPPANRGTINGNGLTRRGFAQSGLGGPSTTIAGISGTAVRRKH